MSERRALVVINPHSLRGESELDAGMDVLRQAGLQVRLRRVNPSVMLHEVVEAEAVSCDLIVLGGGDGTLNRAAPALLRCGQPVGLLPLGTANDLARTLGIPDGLPAACRVIAEGRTRKIDLGVVNGRPFFNVANLGLGVRVTRRLTKERKRRWGPLGYAVAAYDAMRSMRSFRAEINCDGAARRIRTVHLAVGNGRFYGGGMTLSEEAAIDDQRLDLYALEPSHPVRMLLLLPALRRGTQRGRAGVHLMRGREIEVLTDRPMALATDGEITTQTPARFHVIPGGLTVFVPGETP